jgi:hypothetical protein
MNAPSALNPTHVPRTIYATLMLKAQFRNEFRHL